MEFSGNSNEKAVRWALDKLTRRQRETIIRFYCMGQEIIAIAEHFDLSKIAVEHIKRRAVKRLRFLLAPYVKRKYGIEVKDVKVCPLCQDKRLDEIIIKCAPYGPWGEVLRMAKRLNITGVTAASTIIFHYKNHLKEEIGNGK